MVTLQEIYDSAFIDELQKIAKSEEIKAPTRPERPPPGTLVKETPRPSKPDFLPGEDVSKK